jgi:DNA-binding XRE family transcriptional regulator
MCRQAAVAPAGVAAMVIFIMARRLCPAFSVPQAKKLDKELGAGYYGSITQSQMEVPMDFDRVKFTGLRVTKGLTQKELAKLVDVSRPTVAGWEQGTIVPKLSHINSAAAALGVKPEELVTTGEV